MKESRGVLSRFLFFFMAFCTYATPFGEYVRQSREEVEVLVTLLAERYERGTVMLTNNLPFSKWETIFKDPMTTAAAIDRLVHHSVILELNIASYRLEAAKQATPLLRFLNGNSNCRSWDGIVVVEQTREKTLGKIKPRPR
jgi:hypothetical protein